MALTRLRARAVAFSLCLVVAVGLAAPVVAQAVLVGDGSSADPLHVSLPFVHEATLNPAPESGDFDYWYVLHMDKGQTIAVTSTAAPEREAFSIIFSANYTDPYFNSSDYVSEGVERLSYMAPHADDYFVCLIGSTAGTAAVDAATIPTVAFSLKSMSAPSTAKAKKSFTVSSKLAPGYNSSTPPVKFSVQRKVSGKWKSYTTKTATKLTGSAASSTFSTTLKLPKGTFRVRAGFKDAAHVTTKYNSFKTVKVK